MLQAIQQLASDLAKRINENKSEDGYTFVCTHRELRHMVSEAILGEVDLGEAMSEFYDEMECQHNLFIEVSQFDDIVLDERPDSIVHGLS